MSRSGFLLKLDDLLDGKIESGPVSLAKFKEYLEHQEYNVSSLEFIESIRKYRKNWTAYEKVRAKAVNPKIKTINRHKVKSTNNEGSLLSSLNRLSKYETMGSEVTISFSRDSIPSPISSQSYKNEPEMSMPLSPISTWSKTKSLIQRSMIQSPLVLESKNNKSETMFHESTTSQVNSDIFQSYTLINKQTRIIQPGIDKHSVEIPDDSNTLNTLRKVATTASSKHPSQIELRKIIEKEIHYICSKFIVENSVKEINIDQEERSSILAEIMKGNLHPNIFSVVYSNCIDVMNHQSLPAYFTKCSELMSAELTMFKGVNDSSTTLTDMIKIDSLLTNRNGLELFYNVLDQRAKRLIEFQKYV